MTILRTVVFALLLSPVLALTASAQDEQTFPEPLSDNLSDFADELNATEEGRIGRILTEIQETTGIDLVVVTAPGLDGLNGTGLSLEDFGRALFDAWGIGDKKKNDGILVLIDTSAREARITLGAGYAQVYDERAARVLSTALLPKLREGRMAAAIEAGIISARDRLILPFLAGEPVSATDGFEAESSNSPLVIGLGAVGLVGFGGYSLWRRARAKKTCPKCGALTLKRENEVINIATKFQDGLGLQHLTCTSCGFIDRHSYPIKFSSREDRRSKEDRVVSGANVTGVADRDDGDTGFGGGRSNGGGAGGKW